MPRPSEIEWPEALGCSARQGLRVAPDSRFVQLPVEDGPPRARLIADATRLVYALSFDWTAEQLAEFTTFFHETLNAGAEWFNMAVPTSFGLVPHVCHFTGSHSIIERAERPGLYQASFVVEAYSAGYLPPPGLVIDGPVDARTPDDPSEDAYDAGDVTDPLPTDLVNSLTPVAHI